MGTQVVVVVVVGSRPEVETNTELSSSATAEHDLRRPLVSGTRGRRDIDKRTHVTTSPLDGRSKTHSNYVCCLGTSDADRTTMEPTVDHELDERPVGWLTFWLRGGKSDTPVVPR